jgi:hypothetical protein
LSFRNRIICLDGSGSQNGAFNQNVSPPTPAATSGFNGIVRAIAVQPDGKIIVGGDFTTYKGVACNRLARIDMNGAIDATFQANVAAGPNNSVYTIALQPNGDIIIGGAFTTYKAVARGRVARIIGSGLTSTHGNLDGTFTVAGTGFNNTVRTVLLQPDGKLLVGGDFTNFNAFTGINRIARMNANGSFDTQAGTSFTGSFLPGAGFNNIVYSLIMSPRANRFLAVGASTLYSNAPIGKVVEIDYSGAYHAQADGYGNPINVEIGTGASVAFTALKLVNGDVMIGSNGLNVAQLNHANNGFGLIGGATAGGGGGGVAPKNSNLYFANSGNGSKGGDGKVVIAYVSRY